LGWGGGAMLMFILQEEKIPFKKVYFESC